MARRDLRVLGPGQPIGKYQFDRLTWANGEGHAAQTTTINGVNLLLTRVDVLISDPTNVNTVDITFANENSVAVIDPTNFTTLADNTNHILLSSNVPADFASVPIVGDITCTVDPSADSGATSLTVDIIFYGP